MNYCMNYFVINIEYYEFINKKLIKNKHSHYK